MNPFVFPILRAGSRSFALRSCRWGGGRRLPVTKRAFHIQTKHSNQHNDPTDTAELGQSDRAAAVVPESTPELAFESDRTKEDEKEQEDDQQSSTERVAKPPDKRNYGSAKKRATRNRIEARIDIPSWFIEKNVIPHGEQEPTQLIIVPSTESAFSAKKSGSPSSPSSPPQPNQPTTDPTKPTEELTVNGGGEKGTYHIDENLFNEIQYTAAAGLRLSQQSRAIDPSKSKPHLVLQSPKEGAELFLESVVQHVAGKLDVDTISLDAQDIAEIAEENSNIIPDQTLELLRLVGFDAHVIPDEQSFGQDEDGIDEEPPEDGDDSSLQSFGPSPMGGKSGSMGKPIKLSSMLKGMFPDIKSYKVVGAVPFPASFGQPFQPSSMSSSTANSSGGRPFASKDNLSEKEMYMSVIDKFLDGALIKRKDKRAAETPTDIAKEMDEQKEAGLSQKHPIQVPFAKGLIVHIKDYLEVKATRIGGSLLNTIHEVIARRRRLGQPIIIVGTTSSSDLLPSISKSGFRSIQAGTEDSDYRTIITTCKSADADSQFIEDAKYTAKKINCRNVLGVLKQSAYSSKQVAELSAQDDLGFSSDEVFVLGLDEAAWSVEKVQRLASIVFGMVGQSENVTKDHLEKALSIIESSDDSKFAWLDIQRGKSPVVETEEDDDSSRKRVQEARLKQLRKTCNSHEKKLLNGVVDPGSINTTFSDVQAPPSTIEALKTLTSLSLVRPEAFTYGVLATDKIPGLLLYGPPGTGKTLLAKAVAKESGATVLEVSGSDVFDMYVGEGEKNVRAIFSLAKKLAPCVVFIDEADAIFGSRNASGNRTSHRELINQFLREWDGMNQLSAFIMVATNRPFDLDDAVLRRLPRRLLVDLPTEKDREQILRIHLKDEVLASDISLSSIAANTPFYSGSDLKNLSVAAALACVREENDNAAKHTGEEAYKYPEKRTLTVQHFDKAMQEISASISEDMSSLTAIRKFDEKYGDRKGRKKKAGGLGFGMMSEKDREKLREEEARVRNADTAVGL